MYALACLANDGEMLAEFCGAAARQDRDELFLRLEALFAGKGLAIERGVHGANQWVPYELYRDTGIPEEFFFKGKDAEGLREAAADYADAPGSPGPELRADVVDVFGSAALEFAGQAEVEAGEVREDGEGWFAALGFAYEVAHGAD
jgi:hypothetical protein